MNNQRNSVLLLLAIILSLCCVIALAGLVIWNAYSERVSQQTTPESITVA